MSEPIKRSENKTIHSIRTVVELLSQCVVFMAFSAAIILGVVKKPESYLAYAVLIVIPVVAVYFARKYIKSLFLFIVVHAVFLVISVILGNTQAESTAYFVSVLAVCIRSISIRMANVRKTEYMNESMFSTNTEDVSEDEKKAVMQTTEHMSVLYGIVMIVGSTIGGQNGSTRLVSFEAVMFILFVILFLAGNQLKGLSDLFISNTGKSEFPAHRITGINMIVILAVSGLMLIGMLLFYRGESGNIFTVIGTVLGFLFKPLLKLLLIIMHEKDESLPEQNTTTPTTDDDGSYVNMDAQQFDDNPVMQSVFMAFAVVVIVVLAAVVVYLIIKYARKFKESRDENGDKVEFIGESRHERKIKRQKSKSYSTEIQINEQFRKAFKKAAASKKSGKNEGLNAKLNYMQPEDITIKRITDDREAAGRITESYEKARYSDKNISKEELEFMLDFIKNDKYNKRT